MTKDVTRMMVEAGDLDPQMILGTSPDALYLRRSRPIRHSQSPFDAARTDRRPVKQVTQRIPGKSNRWVGMNTPLKITDEA